MTNLARRHVVVDGSNLATEGRSLPSLMQLDEAVRAYRDEWPDDDVLVVVDASFGYRIDESERRIFEEAEDAGEIVSPPAGAVGRGDGFLLRIADRTGAVVLSNDSFQEFHGDYRWLFDSGRLVGGKPVPGVGWIFTPRTPVRGPKSRVAVRDATRATRSAAPAVVRTGPPPPPPGLRTGTAPRRRRSSTVEEAVAEPVAEAVAEAKAEAIDPESTKSGNRRGRRRGAPRTDPEAINEPLPFITFIANHPLGTEIEGTVDSFTSHGAFVIADGARCYAPVVGLGDPPPRSAKEVLKRGDVCSFVIQALDPPRRGIELALPGLARVAGAPTEETVEAEIDLAAEKAPAPARKRAAAVRVASAEKAPVKKAAAKKAVVAATKAAPAKKATGLKKAAPVKKAAGEKKVAAVKKAAAVTKAVAKKATSAGKAAIKNAPGKATLKKAPARKVPAAKKAAAEKKAPATKKAVAKRTAKKAAASAG